MSEQAFEWKLTPTERRIAEMAYADSEGGAWRAVQKVMHLRGERGPWSPLLSNAMCEAMLAELRCEPEPMVDEERLRYLSHCEISVDQFWAVADAANYDGARNATALSEWFARCHARHRNDSQSIGRYRALLERALEALPSQRAHHEWPLIGLIREELDR